MINILLKGSVINKVSFYLFKQWEEKIKKYRNELDLYTKDNMLCTNKTHLILSFSHMYCNRLNGSLTTEQKYRSLLRHTLYDYLKRLEYKKK